jgi:hypothetical protein
MEKKTEIVNVEARREPSTLIELAIEKGSDLDKLEKLLTLKERYEANEARKAYHKAMADFKANSPKIDKDRKVSYKTQTGTTEYHHASLANVTEKISTELSKHGLSASWTTKQNGSVIVTCRITHVQGHSEETSLSAPADSSGSKNNIQAIGSTITYLERYTLLALTGLATKDQDDDGLPKPVEYISEKEKGCILDNLAELEVSLDKFLGFLKVESLEVLPKAQYKQAMAAIEAKKKAKAEKGGAK